MVFGYNARRVNNLSSRHRPADIVRNLGDKRNFYLSDNSDVYMALQAHCSWCHNT